MKPVLVTGGSGLVGSHLIVELLKSGLYRIHSTTRGEKSTAKLQAVADYYGVDCSTVVLHNIDMDDHQAVCSLIKTVDADIVFHTAAIVSLTGRDEQQMIRSNVDMSAAIVDAQLEQKNRGRDTLLIHISSIAALGARTAPELTDEDCPFGSIDKASAYSRSKFLSENEIWRGVAMGLPVVVLNPSVVVGVTGDGTDRSGLQFIFELIGKGIPIYSFGVMGFVDVRDVAHAMVVLSQTPQAKGKRFIISGENLTYKQFIGDLGIAFSHKRPFIPVNKTVLHLTVALLGLWSKITRRPPILTSAMVGFMTDRAYYDGGRIRSLVPDFQYTPFAVSAKMVANRLR